MKKKLFIYIILMNVGISVFGLWILNMENDGFDYKLINIIEKSIEKESTSEIDVEIQTGFFQNEIKFMNGNRVVEKIEKDNQDMAILTMIVISNIIGLFIWILLDKKINNNL